MERNLERRVFFKEIVAESSIMFGLSKRDATTFTHQFVALLAAKVRAQDPVCFGDGKFVPRIQPPRRFNLINGKGGHTGTEYGERCIWRLKMFKR